LEQSKTQQIADKKSGVDLIAYESLIESNAKKTLQVIVLMEEVNRLNHQFNTLRDHLFQAEAHIRETHAYVS